MTLTMAGVFQTISPGIVMIVMQIPLRNAIQIHGFTEAPGHKACEERIIVTNLVAVAIGLASNLWGQTEFLLQAVPSLGEKAREVHLDSLYAVGGLKTAYEDQYEAPLDPIGVV